MITLSFFSGDDVMRHSPVARIASILVILTILGASLSGACRGAHAAEHTRDLPGAHSCPVKDGACDDSSPASPCGEHSDGDHCAAACYCACHLPVTIQPLRLHHAPVMSRLVAGEPFTFLPEVYLPKFIPPQNLA